MTLLENLRLAVVILTIIDALILFIVCPLMDRFDREIPWWLTFLFIILGALVALAVFVLGIILIVVKIKTM